MKKTITRCTCDYCGEELLEYDYERTVKIIIRVELPNPNGACGQCGANEMRLCNSCSDKLGIVNKKEYHDYIDSKSRLKNAINECRIKILEYFFKK